MKKNLHSRVPTDDPSIFEEGGRRFHVPGSFTLKAIFLAFGLGVFSIGLLFLWDPVGRLLFGQTASARVVAIVKKTPGTGDVTYRYRRQFPRERDRSITFQHFVSVRHNGEQRILRLGVDSRVEPYANINDRITICFYPEDDYAFAKYHLRSYGMGVLYFAVGLAFVGSGIPMLLAVGRPIEIDPEASTTSTPAS